jgi:quercetin dioxygenase-like cupin family protein
LAEDEAVPEKAMTVDEVNKKYNVGDRDRHQKAQGKSQVIIEGLNTCYYPILNSLDAPAVSARRTTWIEGERLAFGFFDVPGGYDEPEQVSPHEMFVYVLSGTVLAKCGKEHKTIAQGDIVHVPRGETYRLLAQAPFARYAAVRSTPYLENRIDSMTAEEAEQARVNMKPN